MRIEAEPTIHTRESERKVGDILALDRSQLSAERTLMSWVRTALAIISFGFTIYKFLQVIEEQSKVLTAPRRRATWG
jgi:putative membrane protein